MDHFERKFQGEMGVPHQLIFGTRKVESLGYRMVKKIAEKFNRLSRVHQRHRRQTDDRQQTDRQTESRWQVAIVNASSIRTPLKLYVYFRFVS